VVICSRAEFQTSPDSTMLVEDPLIFRIIGSDPVGLPSAFQSRPTSPSELVAGSFRGALYGNRGTYMR